MKIAHLILAHAAPAQLSKLISALEYRDAWFFVHLDRKADIEAFSFLKGRERVMLIPDRVDVGWGAYSIVEATLRGFRTIVNSGIDFDYLNLLSGADYPLQSPSDIHDFFARNTGKNFMEYYSVRNEWTEAIPRLTEYHLTDYNFPGKYLVQKWMNRLLPTRSMPEGLEPVGRSQWMSLTLDAVRYVLEYLDGHPMVTKFFKLTWAPDEIIFQTILYNSPFRSSLVNDNLRYIDWSKGQASPKVLAEEDLERMWASGKLFARKFDLARFPEVLGEVDRKIQDHHYK
ncbi:beta-1,6-N-acetylglucosaminyltransferase [Dyadobacter jiangsuensis]|uniref:Peptide O-xylosyltransferase n=1 Tax=Dyadobacter jiangsuensis TaxID=1591085 RepID=A0A2P8G874_9BACT|nr:beta-1,6-N-acetylglucosaminyltransferase [Dyadobacter jiangsuensis]PSL30171.1 core-2/I-Branching enzyme [Dyadobacter jiangsuensis]